MLRKMASYFLNRSSNALRASLGRMEAKRVESAVVSSIFFGNALLYRAGAFELRRRIEIGALLAAMKLETTAGASSLGVEPRLQNCTAI
jgi:hypothetical protein